MKLVQTVLIAVIFYMSAKAFAGEHKFTSFTMKDPQKLKSLYDGSDQGISTKGLVIPTPVIVDDNENPLYRQILNEMQGQYEDIGRRQATRALENGKLYGGLNSIGFRYAKSFADFDINLKRQLAPDLFDDTRWIVTDVFTISISASKVLSNLKEQGVIDYTEKQYGLYAGVNFKREIKYVHFADSYTEGLVFNLDKLFLSFSKFKGKDFLKLAPYEFLQKNDYISASVGGIFTAPVYTGVSVKVGAMAKYEQLAKTDIQAIGPDDAANVGERYRVSYEKTKSVTAGVSASVQLDFLNLLQISLLSYDFDYTLSESRKTYLSFYDKHIDDLYGDTALSHNIERLFHSKKVDLDILAPYIVSHEIRKTENMNSKYLVFLFGGQRTQKTQQIEIVKDGVAKSFFRHHYEKIKYKQNVFSRFMAIIFRSFLNMNTVVNKKASDTKKMSIEYDNERDLMARKEDIDVSSKEEKLSISMERLYFAAKTKGRSKKYKKYALKVLEDYSGADPSVIKLFRNDFLVGPVKISSQFKIGKEGIHYFHGLSSSQIYKQIRNMCSSSKFSFRNIFGGCKSKVSKAYEKYLVEWTHNDIQSKDYKKCKKYKKRRRWSRRFRRHFMKKCTLALSKKSSKGSLKDVPLWRLKSFTQTMFEQSKSKVDLFAFYGIYNVFSYGKFEATNTMGQPFKSYFNEGKFRGLGVVDSFMRNNQLRTPASVPIN